MSREIRSNDGVLNERYRGKKIVFYDPNYLTYSNPNGGHAIIYRKDDTIRGYLKKLETIDYQLLPYSIGRIKNKTYIECMIRKDTTCQDGHTTKTEIIPYIYKISDSIVYEVLSIPRQSKTIFLHFEDNSSLSLDLVTNFLNPEDAKNIHYAKYYSNYGIKITKLLEKSRHMIKLNFGFISDGINVSNICSTIKRDLGRIPVYDMITYDIKNNNLIGLRRSVTPELSVHNLVLFEVFLHKPRQLAPEKTLLRVAAKDGVMRLNWLCCSLYLRMSIGDYTEIYETANGIFLPKYGINCKRDYINPYTIVSEQYCRCCDRFYPPIPTQMANYLILAKIMPSELADCVFAHME